MNSHTLDVNTDEMLLMVLLLGQFIDHQNAVLRDATTDEEGEAARGRLDIATRLRGRLPLHIEYGEPDADEQ